MHNRWVVLKFGGTSVTGEDNWIRIQQIVQRKIDAGYRVLLVCSALSSVSNRLETLANKAEKGNEFVEELKGIEEHHLSQTRALSLSKDVIADLLDDLRRLAHGASLIQEVSPKLWARILSAGELMSTKLGASWLAENGTSVYWMDARSVLKTEDREGASGYLSATASYCFDPSLISMQRRIKRE